MADDNRPTTEKRLVASIVQFFGDQLTSSDLSTDAKESLEVAIQCLESAYNVSSSDVHLLPSKGLLEIFSGAIQGEPTKEKAEAATTEEAKAEAERLKNEGNNLMKSEKFDEALKCYTKAIQLDGRNAVFYCNRAAAYSKLSNHTFALEDCRRAIEIDPQYSKAYGRMGLAYASLNDHYRARDCYKKAVELDPSNESYKSNLSIAEEKVAEMERQDPLSALAGGLGNFDIGSVLQNPALMQMASQVMADPAMQNLMTNIMGGLAGGAPPTSAPTADTNTSNTAGSEAANGAAGAGIPPIPGGLDGILRAGQAFAQRMQESNPDLINQLREQVQRNPRSDSNPEDKKQ